MDKPVAGETPQHPISGDGLRPLRVAKHVCGSAVARRYGVTKQRIGAIEAMVAPTTATVASVASVARYLAAREAAEQDG